MKILNTDLAVVNATHIVAVQRPLDRNESLWITTVDGLRHHLSTPKGVKRTDLVLALVEWLTADDSGYSRFVTAKSLMKRYDETKKRKEKEKGVNS